MHNRTATDRCPDISPEDASARSALLVLDASYTLEMIRERSLEKSVLCRDLDGYFRHVWSVHPFASMLTSPDWTPKFGKPQWHRLAERHTFVEGKVGRFSWLSRLFPVNFLLGQTSLFLDLLRLIKRERIDFIRTGDPLYLGLFGWALSRLTGAAFVIRVNGNNDKCRESTGKPVFPRLFRTTAREEAIERFLFPRADLVVAPTADNIAFAVTNGAHPDRVAVFPNGNLLSDEYLDDPERRACDEDLFDQFGIKPRNYILTVGRLEEVKLPVDVLKAFAELRQDGYDVDLVYAGDGSMRESLSQTASELGVRDAVHFLGNQNQRSLAQLNTFASVVVSPLTGRALAESALCAAPIVAYDLDWQSEIIETGKTGELVPHRDPRLIATATRKFLDDREYSRAMGRAVRDRVREMFDVDGLNEHERQQYARVMASLAAIERRHGSI